MRYLLCKSRFKVKSVQKRLLLTDYTCQFKFFLAHQHNDHTRICNYPAAIFQ